MVAKKDNAPKHKTAEDKRMSDEEKISAKATEDKAKQTAAQRGEDVDDDSAEGR